MYHRMAVGSPERVIGRVRALDTSMAVMADSVRGMRLRLGGMGPSPTWSLRM
jgi:hypothetical protein